MDLPCEMLLHPELLTNEQLANIIQERQLKVPGIQMMSRDQLLDLFHHYCVPYGQRKYRDSGRGKLLNKTRQMSPELKPKLNIWNNNQSRKLTHSWSNERLKPPPDLLSGHMKRIKIENKFVPVFKDASNCKRKMSVDSDPLATDNPPPKKERKPISWP